MSDTWGLTETEIRAKVRELYRLRNQHRMDAWLFSGINLHIIDADIAERVMNEELLNLDHDTFEFWTGQCDTCKALG